MGEERRGRRDVTEGSIVIEHQQLGPPCACTAVPTGKKVVGEVGEGDGSEDGDCDEGEEEEGGDEVRDPAEECDPEDGKVGVPEEHLLLDGERQSTAAQAPERQPNGHRSPVPIGVQEISNSEGDAGEDSEGRDPLPHPPAAAAGGPGRDEEERDHGLAEDDDGGTGEDGGGG